MRDEQHLLKQCAGESRHQTPSSINADEIGSSAADSGQHGEVNSRAKRDHPRHESANGGSFPGVAVSFSDGSAAGRFISSPGARQVRQERNSLRANTHGRRDPAQRQAPIRLFQK